MESLVVGPPHEPYTFVPPVISVEARDRIATTSRLANARAVQWRKVDCRTRRAITWRQSVFEGIAADSRLSCEEVFGPVLVLSGADDFESAVRASMDSAFALTGGVFSRNPRNIAFARREFRVGNLYINRKTTGAVVGRQPFGGYAMSGTGQRRAGRTT